MTKCGHEHFLRSPVGVYIIVAARELCFRDGNSMGMHHCGVSFCQREKLPGAQPKYEGKER